MPYWGWNTAITTAPIRLAIAYNIKLILWRRWRSRIWWFKETENQAIFSVQYQKDIYMEGFIIKLSIINLRKKKQFLLHIQMTQNFIKYKTYTLVLF